MSAKTAIEEKLQGLFNPERLVLVDESERHAGHFHEPDAPEITHLRVRIVSSRFEGMSRIARHRAVNEALQEEIAAGLHALAIEAAAPGEATRW
ncbi:BolA family transcriptional regulator [Martelella alba]|uniref:BolA family transcriptional regulator n=1 Tax=Martelella alba TaxID=2590451 RepID=A0A506UGP6_9HYPH|nr:BolA family protein [Martelella alba]TPW32615.1 BolA family transcriptional regulator [Martelella alba]